MSWRATLEAERERIVARMAAIDLQPGTHQQWVEQYERLLAMLRDIEAALASGSDDGAFGGDQGGRITRAIV
jgi:hypothetical protein